MLGFFLSAIKIIFLLGFLIFIHEGGHFLVAKLCKVKVNQFAIGFGPELISKQKGETKYALRAIPLGGFVSMEGEEEASEENGAFNKASIPKRIAIVAAGAIVNIIFGLIMYFILVAIIYGSLQMAGKATLGFSGALLDSVKMIFTGQVGADDLTGPVGISELVSKTTGVKEYLYIMVVVSVSLGITNLLPIPALDGGKILLLLIEAIRRKQVSDKVQIQLQLFIDTPGIHKPKTKLNENMIELSWDAISNSDVILFLIEADSKEIGRGDMKILEKIREANKKCILIINKVDLINKEELAKLIDLYKNEYDFSAIIPISATKNKYKEVVLDEIEKNLKPGPAYYDQDEYTDQTLRQLAEETIREKALILLRDEVPHGIFVQVEKMKLKKTQKNEDIYNIEATIYCLRNSHKGIIIGKNGEMLKRIGTMARKDMEQNFGTKVNLKTWVKVKEDWMNNEKFFNE